MSAWYLSARTALLAGDIDFDADTLSMALAGPGFAFDDTDVNVADVAGLLPVAPQAITVSSVANARVLVGDVTFGAVGGTDHVTALVVYRNTGVPATSPLICAIDSRADTVPLDVTPNGGDLTFTFNYLVKI